MKTIKLTESELKDIVTKVILEQGLMASAANAVNSVKNFITGNEPTAPSQTGNDRIANLASVMRDVRTKQMPQQVIISSNPKLSGMLWNDYVNTYKITKQEIEQAKALLTKIGGAQPTTKSTVVNKTGGGAPGVVNKTGGGVPGNGNTGIPKKTTTTPQQGIPTKKTDDLSIQQGIS